MFEESLQNPLWGCGLLCWAMHYVYNSSSDKAYSIFTMLRQCCPVTSQTMGYPAVTLTSLYDRWQHEHHANCDPGDSKWMQTTNHGPFFTMNRHAWHILQTKSTAVAGLSSRASGKVWMRKWYDSLHGAMHKMVSWHAQKYFRQSIFVTVLLLNTNLSRSNGNP